MELVKLTKENDKFTLSITLENKNDEICGELTYVGEWKKEIDDVLARKKETIENLCEVGVTVDNFNELLNDIRLVLSSFSEIEMSGSLSLKDGYDENRAIIYGKKYEAPDSDITFSFERKNNMLSSCKIEKKDNKTNKLYSFEYNEQDGSRIKVTADGNRNTILDMDAIDFEHNISLYLLTLNLPPKKSNAFELEPDKLSYYDKYIAMVYYFIYGEAPDYSNYNTVEKTKSIIKLFDYVTHSNLTRGERGGYDGDNFISFLDRVKLCGKIEFSQEECEAMLDKDDRLEKATKLKTLIAEFAKKYEGNKEQKDFVLGLLGAACDNYANRFFDDPTPDQLGETLYLEDPQDKQDCFDFVKKLNEVFERSVHYSGRRR